MPKQSALSAVRTLWTKFPPVKSVNLSGRTVVITGANTGLGFEAAKHFARMKPAHLILACRDKQKGVRAVAEIEKETGFTPDLMLFDANDFASVSSFATALEERYTRLDILVCNAGVQSHQWTASKDGWEENLQVNHLSTALLSLLLLPRMVGTASSHGTSPRISIVASGSHAHANIHNDGDVLTSGSPLKTMSDQKFTTPKEMRLRYNDTKLLNVQFARSLSARLPQDSPIVVNSVNPGFCHSSIRRNAPLLSSILLKPLELALARPTEEGSRALVSAALVGEDDAELRKSVRGAYMSECRVAEPSDWVVSDEGKAFEGKVWDETLQILEKADPRVKTVVDQYLKT